jgi:hypothetical protein
MQASEEMHKSRQGKPKFKIKIIHPINLYRRGFKSEDYRNHNFKKPKINDP